MTRRRNNITCNLFVQRTQGKLSPVVSNNKTRYVLYRKAGWVAMEQAVDARESSWSGCTWQVRLMTANFGAWELTKATEYHETKDREELCVSICTAVGSPFSTVYSRIRFVRPMTTALLGIGAFNNK